MIIAEMGLDLHWEVPLASYNVVFCVQVHGADARSQAHPGKAASLSSCELGVWN